MNKFPYNSTLFKLLSAEAEEINKLKWLESERENKDIGKDRAIHMWCRYHKTQWYLKHK